MEMDEAVGRAFEELQAGSDLIKQLLMLKKKNQLKNLLLLKKKNLLMNLLRLKKKNELKNLLRLKKKKLMMNLLLLKNLLRKKLVMIKRLKKLNNS